MLALAEEIRRTLITALSRTGGHLGPNLGVVELTIALHRVFATPRDKFVFDVAHQGYVHKMLTGRADRIHTIRTWQGLNGFLLRTESRARLLRRRPRRHRAVRRARHGRRPRPGRATTTTWSPSPATPRSPAARRSRRSTTSPQPPAASSSCSTTTNGRSTRTSAPSPAISTRCKPTTTYAAVRAKAAEFVEKVAGKAVRHLAHKVEEGAKHLLFPNVLFEEFGLRYYGPIDGHDIPLLVKTFEHLKKLDEPVVLHIITEKGRGYQPALDNPGKFHGLGAYKIEDGSTDTTSTPTCSEIFGRTVTDFAKQDPKIVAITAAMPGGTKLDIFKEEIPDRYFDVGIAEEHAALFACGLATQGFKPFLAIYSTFMQRAYDMIIHDMALQNLPVRLCMDRGGLSGDDGPTHHGLFDIGFLRHIPNLVHMQPKDEDEFVDMLHTMAAYDDGPIAIRYPRGTITGATPKERPRAVGNRQGRTGRRRHRRRPHRPGHHVRDGRAKPRSC